MLLRFFNPSAAVLFLLAGFFSLVSSSRMPFPARTACQRPRSRPSLQHASSLGSLDYQCSFCLHRLLSRSSRDSHADSIPIPVPWDNGRCIRSRLRVQYRRRFTPVGHSFRSRSLWNQCCDLWWSYLPVPVPHPLAAQPRVKNTRVTISERNNPVHAGLVTDTALWRGPVRQCTWAGRRTLDYQTLACENVTGRHAVGGFASLLEKDRLR